MKLLRNHIWLLPLFVLFISSTYFSPGLMLDIDNLKYLGIAWGMQHTGHYIIPVANGELYTDKPPLLFWMIIICWRIFGVNMLALQFMICLVMSLWVVLARATYATLFPDDAIGKNLLPYLVIGCFGFFDYAHFLHVDLFLVLGVLLANLGIVRYLCNDSRRVSSIFIILGVFIGLFAKGPVIYVFSLLPYLVNVLLNKSCRHYFSKIFSSMLIGTLLFICAWVIPVFFNANHEFLQQIVYGQIAHRAVTHSDKSYFLFYFIKLLYILLPWSLALIFIRKFTATVRGMCKSNLFIFLVIMVGVLILTSFGQKRFWYLLPCIPYALIIFSRFFVDHFLGRIRSVKITAFVIAVTYFAMSPYFFAKEESAKQVNQIAAILQQASRNNVGIAVFSSGSTSYAFNYFTRMLLIPVISDAAGIQAWLVQHPYGFVISKFKTCPPSTQVRLESGGAALLCQGY